MSDPYSPWARPDGQTPDANSSPEPTIHLDQGASEPTLQFPTAETHASTSSQGWAAPTGEPTYSSHWAPGQYDQTTYLTSGGSQPPHGHGPHRRKVSTGLIAVASALVGAGLMVALPGVTSNISSVLPHSSASSSSQSGSSNSGSSGSSSSGTSGGSSLPSSGSSGGIGNGGLAPGSTSTATQTTATASESKGVVLINTVTTSGEAAGTGMVLSSNGYILTNYHVVQTSTSIKVNVASTDTTYTATVVGHDATNDVALLKVSATGMQTVTVDTATVSVNDKVTAVGNSEGQGYLSAADGTVTALNATLQVTNEESASGSETLTGAIETTAAAVPGDSGGPMYDSQGEVIGMTTAGETSGSRYQSTVASYAIPIAKALSIVNTIESGHASGTVKIGPNAYLGITVQSSVTGAPVVGSVNAGTPAEKAGLVAGDTITAVAGVKVSSQATLSAALQTHKPGDWVRIDWVDAYGTAHHATVTLASSPVN